MTRAICLLFGVGLLRPGPGTWGSAVAILLGLAINHWLGFPALVAATIAVTLIGWWALRAELSDTHEDPSEFVIDEVAGQWLALLFPAAAFWSRGMDMVWPGWVAAFVFFRLFDIWKPWLVGRADQRGDAWGVMADDLWAGLFAGIATILAAGLAHGMLM